MRLDKFYGLNNQQKPSEYGFKGAAEALNVDITDNFKLVRRNGQAKLHSLSIEAAASTGEGEILYQSNGELFLMSSQSVEGVRVESGLTKTEQLNAYKINDDVIWSNGVETGVVKVRPQVNLSLGVPTPMLPAFKVQTGGNLPAGQYLATITAVRADGYESSANQAAQIQMEANGAIAFEAVSVEASNLEALNQTVAIRLYLSHVDGKELYFAGEYPLTGGTYAGDTLDLIHPLRDQFCDAAPVFDDCVFYRGCMYYVVANVLYASLPYKFGTVDYAQDYVQFESAIKMIAAEENGIYIATENETSYLAGATIRDMTRIKVLDYGAISGTVKRIYASTINPNQPGNVNLWATNRGLVAGFDGGQVVNLTDQVFAFPDALQGTAALREENGLRQLIVSV